MPIECIHFGLPSTRQRSRGAIIQAIGLLDAARRPRPCRCQRAPCWSAAATHWSSASRWTGIVLSPGSSSSFYLPLAGSKRAKLERITHACSIILDLPARLVNVWRFRQTSTAPSEVRAAALESLYAEVCKAHDAITYSEASFSRSCLPHSGAAFALIIGTREDFNLRLLLPVGTFGVAVALGLFFYELRGMLLCVELRNRGEKLEQAMQRPASDAEEEMNGPSSIAQSIIK